VYYYTLSSIYSFPATNFLVVFKYYSENYDFLGIKRMPTSGSRSEFVTVDLRGSPADISRGCFVSTKKALLLGLSAIAAMVLVGILVKYLSTYQVGKSARFCVGW
jgi:hypothetical protein